MYGAVMEPTEEDAAIAVGAATVGVPVVGVVGFAVRGGNAARGPHASAVAHGESDALLRREEPLLPAHVEGVAAGVDRDLDRADVAQRAIDHRSGE